MEKEDFVVEERNEWSDEENALCRIQNIRIMEDGEEAEEESITDAGLDDVDWTLEDDDDRPCLPVDCSHRTLYRPPGYCLYSGEFPTGSNCVVCGKEEKELASKTPPEDRVSNLPVEEKLENPAATSNAVPSRLNSVEDPNSWQIVSFKENTEYEFMRRFFKLEPFYKDKIAAAISEPKSTPKKKIGKKWL